MFKKILTVSLFVLLLVPAVASAQFSEAQGKLGNVAGKTGLSSDLGTSVGTIIKGALSLVGTIFLILTVYAGILWMTASGNEDKVNKSKNILVAAIIGLAITMAAYAITSFVTAKLGQ